MHAHAPDTDRDGLASRAALATGLMLAVLLLGVPSSAVAAFGGNAPYTKLTAPPDLTSDFGGSVAVSSDGLTAVIGGETDNGGAGAAWVFVRTGETWVQQGPKLTPRDEGHSTRFGSAVAISGDGDTVLVGDGEGTLGGWIFTRSSGAWRQQGPRLTPRHAHANGRSSRVVISAGGSTAVITSNEDEASETQGVAWVFVRSGSRWRQQGPRLTGRGNSESVYCAALSANGNALLLGTISPGYEGSAWVFIRSHSRWRQDGRKLPGSGTQEFGTSVALSANGQTALVGATPGGHSSGSARVYTRSRTGWVKRATLTAHDHEGGHYFGSFVALSNDGRTALVAAPGGSAGSAFVFTRSNGSWTRSARLTDRNGLGDTLALSGDGDTIIEPPIGTDPTGIAHVYSRSNTTWTERTPMLEPFDESGRDSAGFGRSVMLSADGDTALVSESPALVSEGGGVWVFIRSGIGWVRQGPRLTVEGSDGNFGRSVALSADGNTVVIGDPAEAGAKGTVWVFTRSGETWSQQGPGLTSSEASSQFEANTFGEGFGFKVAISGDGNTVLAGDPSDAGGFGGAWVFARSGTTWAQQGAKLTPNDELSEGASGFSVALSEDGDTALIGGPYDDRKAFDGVAPANASSGAAWMFTYSSGSWTQQGAKLVAGAGHQVNAGVAVALSADASTALIGGNGNAWVFANTASGWTQQGPSLTGTGSDPFGQSVAISANGDTALIGGIPGNDCGKYMYELCSRTGTVWAFDRTGSAWTRQPSTLTGPGMYGSSISLSASGETALIGDSVSDIDSLQGGAAFVFALTPSPPG